MFMAGVGAGFPGTCSGGPLDGNTFNLPAPIEGRFGGCFFVVHIDGLAHVYAHAVTAEPPYNELRYRGVQTRPLSLDPNDGP